MTPSRDTASASVAVAPSAEARPDGEGALRRDGVAQLILLGLLCALPPLAIDMALPAMAGLASSFNDSGGKTGLTLSLFMVGFGLTPLIYGLASDRIGRKVPLLLGVALFTLGGLACALATSLDDLLLARVLQGAGAGAGPTLAYASLRDRLTGSALHRGLALLTMILGVAPVIAPSLGALVLEHGDWRMVYFALAGSGGLMFLFLLFGFEETWRDRREEASDGQGGDRPDGQTLAYGLVRGLSAGSMFAYVAGSPFLLIQTFGVNYRQFGLLFALTAGGLVLGSALAARLSRGGRVRGLVRLGVSLALIGPVVAGVALWLNRGGLVAPMAGFVAATFGYGLIMPTASHAALSRAPKAAGMVSAAMNSFQMACMVVASVLVAAWLAGLGSQAMIVVMVAFALASASLLPALAPVE